MPYEQNMSCVHLSPVSPTEDMVFDGRDDDMLCPRSLRFHAHADLKWTGDPIVEPGKLEPLTVATEARPHTTETC